MATTKKTAKKVKSQKRVVSVKEADKIIDKYYSLKNALYSIVKSDKYTDPSRKLAQKALTGLEKWRLNVLDTARMTGFRHD